MRTPEQQSKRMSVSRRPSRYTLPLALRPALGQKPARPQDIQVRSGSVSIGVSSESGIAIAGLANWLQDLGERFTTSTTELLSLGSRQELQPELDIDLPSMGRVVGRRRIRVTSRISRVPYLGNLSPDLEVAADE